MTSGEILLLLGANGSGKSTLLKCINNIISPSEGYVLFNGVKNNILQRKGRLATIYGYLSQNQTHAPDIPTEEYAVTGRSQYIRLWQKPSKEDYDIIFAKFEELKISHLLAKSYARISGGEQQLVQIARVLCQEPSVILFDEPTSQLDFGNQYRILDVIKSLQSKGYIIIVTTHNPHHATYLDCGVGLISDGNLQNGSIEELTSKRLSDMYKIPISVNFIEKKGKKSIFIAPEKDIL